MNDFRSYKFCKCVHSSRKTYEKQRNILQLLSRICLFYEEQTGSVLTEEEPFAFKSSLKVSLDRYVSQSLFKFDIFRRESFEIFQVEGQNFKTLRKPIYMRTVDCVCKAFCV